MPSASSSIASRQAQKSDPSDRPLSARWNAWLWASTNPGSCKASGTRERIRADLRRLVAGGLVLLYLAAPALARAGTVAIFYYPWYGTPLHDGAWSHWNQNAHTPPVNLYSRYYPATGPYSSADARVVDQQMAEIATAGVDEIVISWWGRGSPTDNRLPLVLTSARRHGVQSAIHLEPY